MEHKAIRLRYSARSGKEILPPGAVIDAEPSVAAELIEKQLADETDSLERYPNFPLLTIVHECPVQGEAPTPPPVVYPPDHDAPIDVFGRKVMPDPNAATTLAPSPTPRPAPPATSPPIPSTPTPAAPKAK